VVSVMISEGISVGFQGKRECSRLRERVSSRPRFDDAA
jgi:hypothetical protein